MERPNENEIIKIILETIGRSSNDFSQINDDVSLFSIKNTNLVISTDMLVKKTDAPQGMATWQIARKSLVACVSDFAAKGVQPKASLISLGIKSGTTREEIYQLGEGFKKATQEYHFEIIGGDTNETEDLIIDCCMIGFSKKIIGRQGAKPGDRIFVTGFFGYPPLGLKIIYDNIEVLEKTRQKAISSIFLPTPKLELALTLSKIHTFSASIDSSDGLAISLHQLAEASKVGIEISNLPVDQDIIDAAKKVNLDVKDLVFNGGEEYEIVCSIPEEKCKEAKEKAQKMGTPLIEIGKVTSEQNKIIFNDGKQISNIERKGWVHLS